MGATREVVLYLLFFLLIPSVFRITPKTPLGMNILHAT